MLLVFSDATTNQQGTTGVLPGIEVPGDEEVDAVENAERPKRGFRSACDADRRAVGLGYEESAVGGNGGRKGNDRSAFPFGLFQCIRLIKLGHQLRHLVPHDGRYHLERRCVTYTREEKQRHKAGKESPEGTRLGFDTEEKQHAADGNHHAEKRPQGDPAATVLV